MASPKSVGRSGVNTTFRTGTGLRYPVWKVILDFAKCSRHFEVATTRKSERTVVILQVNSQVGTNSEWLCLAKGPRLWRAKGPNIQVPGRGLLPHSMSWPYDTQPWLVRCVHPPRVALCCRMVQCVAVYCRVQN